MKRLTYLCLVCLLLISSVARAATIRTVALSGQQAPGALSGVNYSGFTSLALNEASQTAFSATLTGSGVDSTNNSGYWSEGSGSLALVARAGSQAPGTPSGVNFGRVNSSTVLNDAGQTAFRADLADGSSRGIWSEGSGSLALVALSGDHAPGTRSGVNYDTLFGMPVLNNAGQTAFYAPLTGSGVGLNNEGIWSERSGSLALVARAGDPAPGMPSGVNFGGISTTSSNTVLNDAGQTAFWAYLTGSGVVRSFNDQGIWSEGSGSLALVARTGSQAPGTPSGVNYRYFVTSNLSVVLNNAGQTAFQAYLTGSGVGIWSEGSGSLALVARSGDHAPGTPSGVNFNNVITTSEFIPVLNDAGQTAFYAGLTDGGSGIWSEGSGSLALVARDGEHAPGTPSGVNFRNLHPDTEFKPALNDAGQTAFQGSLTGIGVNSTSNQGIWATDRTGVLQLIARTGDPLEVAPGDFRTISALVFSAATGNSGGRRSLFSNLGQLAFRANFTDGSSGIFVSNRVAVPEPSSLLLAALAAVALLQSRRVRDGRGRQGTLILTNRHSSGLAQMSVD